MSYLLTRGGQQYGPYEPDALQQMLVAGQITQGDLVWMEGMPAWVPVAQVLQPQPAPLAPVFATPAYSVPAAAVPATPGAGPIPPSMHWVVVLLLGGITLGIFVIVWAFKQAGFVKKISPQINGRALLFAVLWIELIFVVITILTTFFMHGASDVPMPILGAVLSPLVSVLAIVAVFRMRRGLLNYYNTVEPIQLRLSGAMTFFFSVYYFQHHLSRIAHWKKTGQLVPQ